MEVHAIGALKGKSQANENGIIQCAFVLSKFSMWAKLLNHSAVKLLYDRKTATTCWLETFRVM